MEKKKAHNDLEKKRKDKLKIAIDNIRKAMPHRIINNKKLTHFDVLNVAIDYIKQLETQNKDFLENNTIALGEETILLRDRVDKQTQQIYKLLEIIEKCYITNGVNLKNNISVQPKSVNKENDLSDPKKESPACNKQISKLLSIKKQQKLSIATINETIEHCIPLFASSDLPLTTQQIVIIQPTSSQQISNQVNLTTNICSVDKATDTNQLSIIANNENLNCAAHYFDSIDGQFKLPIKKLDDKQKCNQQLDQLINNKQLESLQLTNQQLSYQQPNTNNICNVNLNRNHDLEKKQAINLHSNDEQINNCNSLSDGMSLQVVSSYVNASTQTSSHSKFQSISNQNKLKNNYRMQILQRPNYRNFLRKCGVKLFCDHCSNIIKIKSKKNQEIGDNLIDELNKNISVGCDNVESLINCQLSNSNQFTINDNNIASDSPSLQNKSHFNEYSIENSVNTTSNIDTVEPVLQTKSLNPEFEHGKNIEGKSKQNIWMPARIVDGIVDADSFVSSLDQPQYQQVSDSTKQFEQNSDLLDNAVCFQLPPFHSSYCLHPATQTKNYAHDISTLLESQKLNSGEERMVNIFDNLPPADNLLYSFDYLADADLSIFDDAFDKSNQISFPVFDKNSQAFEKNQTSFWQSSLFEPMRCQKNNLFDSYIFPGDTYDKDASNVEFILKEPSSTSSKLQHKPTFKPKLTTFNDINKKIPTKEETNSVKEVKVTNFSQMYGSKTASDNFDLLKLTSGTINKSSEGKSIESTNALVTFRPHEQLSDSTSKRPKFDNQLSDLKRAKYCSEFKSLIADSCSSSNSQNHTLFNNSIQANNTCHFKKSIPSVNSVVFKNNQTKYPESLKSNAFNEAPFYENVKHNTITNPVFMEQFNNSFKSDDFKSKSKRTNIIYDGESKSSIVSPSHRSSMQKDFSFYPLSYYDNTDENKVDAYYSNWSCMNRQKVDTSTQQNLLIHASEVLPSSYDQSTSTSNHLAFSNLHLKPFTTSLYPSTNLECDKIQHTNFDSYITDRTKSKKIIEKLQPDQNMCVNDQQPTYLNPSSRIDSSQVSDDNFKIDHKNKKKVSSLPPIHHFGIRNLCNNNQLENKLYTSNNLSSNQIDSKPHSFSHNNFQPSIFNNNQLPFFNHNNSQSSLLNQNNNQPPLFSHNNNNQSLLFNHNSELSIFNNNDQPPLFNHNNNQPILFNHNNNQPPLFNQNNQNLFNHINDQQPLFNQNNETSIFNHNNNPQQSLFSNNNNSQVITINKLLGYYNQQ